MRLTGFTLLALLVTVTAAWAQQPGAPGVPKVPGVPPALPLAVAPADQKLEGYLAGWEKATSSLVNLRVELELIRTDPVFKTDKKYTGVVVCMKPNYAVLRLDYTADPKDYEAFICNGKAVYAYSGLDKTITEWKLPDPKTNPAGVTDNLMIDFLSGMKAKAVKDRFDITVFKEDDYYVYLDIKPKRDKDKQEFKQLKLALFRPHIEGLAFLPAQIFMVKPNDTTEQWKLGKHKSNIPGITEKDFEYKDVPGYRRVQGTPEPAPVVRPGTPTPPKVPGRP
jgi:TIGR03009 family protein